MLKFLSSSPTLGELAVGKDNNFNLLRLLAAFAVLFSHSFAMLGQPEPFAASVGKNLGAMAVDVFFVTSGFLVCASLMRSRNALDYLRARVLRIFPALWVMLVLTVFVLGAYVSRLDFVSYLRDAQTWHYLLKNALLMGDIEFYLRGVFERNHLNGIVNGSLWSMVYELNMYLMLLLSYSVYCYVAKIRSQVIALTVALVVLVGAWFLLDRYYLLVHAQLLRFVWFFFIGSFLYLIRHRVPMSGRIMTGIIAASIIALSISGHAFLIVYYLTLPYVLFYLAYVPTGKIRAFNRLGDYSYGVYLYAFPLQQALVASYSDWTVSMLVIGAGVLTLMCAICSWHWIERPILALRK
ncbi:acyltransferase family protein [Undibacterium flavidum]|uniref:Acyltransferase n=1 Tax=Undibacterium flavidum TaxID=2762297 RepID=A0ABR6YAT1_9BURK|nr:acyltransferase [Undibacterium flavidum]MBC3873660.1 acyltransferase [Undibacterium flavidum]